MIASLAITNTGSANTSARDVSIKSSPQFSDSMQNKDDVDTSSFEMKDSRELNDKSELNDGRERTNRQAESQQAAQSKSQSTDNDKGADKDASDEDTDGSSLAANGQTPQSPKAQTSSNQQNNTQVTAQLTQVQQLAQLTQEGDVNTLKSLNTKVGSEVGNQQSQAIGQALTPQQAMTANLLQQGKHTGTNQSTTSSVSAATFTTTLANGQLSSLPNSSELNLNNQYATATKQTSSFIPAGAFAFNSESIETALSQLGQTGQNVVDEAAQLISQHGRTQAKVSQWGPVPMSQSAPLTQQAQELLSPLREQLRFQVDQQIKHAEVRLDPPELGKIELNIRLDGDKLHIQMTAANTSVRDALQLSLDKLRDDLAMDHGGQIDLDISQGEHQQQRENPSQVASIATPQGESVDTQSQQPQSLVQNQVDLLA